MWARVGATNASLADLVDARADESPDDLLFVDDRGRRMSCAEFQVASDRTAKRLAGLGVGPDSLVSWILPTSIEALVIMVALSRLGAVQNPIIPMYREREIGHILDEASIDAMIVVPNWADVDYKRMTETLSRDRGGVPVVWTLDEVLGESASLERISSQRGAIQKPARWVFYTSGSSGVPKGCRHTDQTLLSTASGMSRYLQMSAADRSGIAFPIAHIGGAVNLMAALLSGATLILIERFSRDSIPVLADEKVTMAGSGTAFHLAYLEAQAVQPGQPIFPFLRCCPGGGAPKPPGLHERVKHELGGVGILSGWGLTEAPVLTMSRPQDPDEKLSDTEGTPLPGVAIRVVGPDGRQCEAGEPGELRVQAPQQMLGYVNRQLDAEVFDEEGSLRTGDLGIVDPDGFVRITGRLKDVVIRNGENVATAEVEELLRAHPDVTDAAVIGLPDPRTGERVCAVIELTFHVRPLNVELVGTYLEEAGLRRIAWPEQIEIVTSLPRNVAGKVDKSALKQAFTPDADSARRDDRVSGKP
jgi:acyl-CoA synthetase (AMP-forming)/AMP-acid ligase II